MTGANTWYRRLGRLTGFRVAAAILAVMLVCAVAPGVVVSPSPGPHDPTACAVRAADGSYQDRLAPSGRHWFGTDTQGCDVFARVVYGARSSLVIGVGASLVMAVVGMALGLLAAVRGGWVDALVRRAGDVTLSLPFVVGAILLLAVFAGEQRSSAEIVVALAVLSWPATARLTRTAARQVMVQPYVEAARAAGAGTHHVMIRHVLPNSAPVVAAYSAMTAGALIAAESTLTYLGIGLRVPSVSWGLMIEQAERSYERSPHLVVFPALFLTVTVAAFVLLGDAIRDGLDVHLDDRPDP